MVTNTNHTRCLAVWKSRSQAWDEQGAQLTPCAHRAAAAPELSAEASQGLHRGKIIII